MPYILQKNGEKFQPSPFRIPLQEPLAAGAILTPSKEATMADTIPPMDRRTFLELGAAAALGVAAGGALQADPPAGGVLPFNPATAKAMPTRKLGGTGHQVGIFSLGCQAALEQPNNAAAAVPLLERALDLGVNYLDTSAVYGGPARWSEQYVGEVMKRRRAHAFLATKTHDRSADGSLRLLDTSLKLLNTDHVDLWQLHAMATKTDVDRVFAKGGAVEALLKAREQKLVRYVGITGHTDPEVLMEAIRRFPFDCLLMAFNAADPHHLSFRSLLDLAAGKGMGIIGMKITARGRLLKGYQPGPHDKQWGSGQATRPGTLTMQEAMGYSLSHPLSTVIIGVDNIAQVEQNVALARAFVPFPATQLKAIEAKAAPVADQAQWFKRR
jgi:hypothetical protein